MLLIATRRRASVAHTMFWEVRAGVAYFHELRAGDELCLLSHARYRARAHPGTVVNDKGS